MNAVAWVGGEVGGEGPCTCFAKFLCRPSWFLHLLVRASRSHAKTGSFVRFGATFGRLLANFGSIGDSFETLVALCVWWCGGVCQRCLM